MTLKEKFDRAREVVDRPSLVGHLIFFWRAKTKFLSDTNLLHGRLDIVYFFIAFQMRLISFHSGGYNESAEAMKTEANFFDSTQSVMTTRASMRDERRVLGSKAEGISS